VARVTFQKLLSEKSQETFGDEPYLVYNGEKITRNINVVRDVIGSGRVVLFESDLARDDVMAAFTIFESQAGQGQQTQRMNGNGARYTLSYVVE
jgi:hypothetical protein